MTTTVTKVISSVVFALGIAILSPPTFAQDKGDQETAQGTAKSAVIESAEVQKEARLRAWRYRVPVFAGWPGLYHVYREQHQREIAEWLAAKTYFADAQ